MKPKVREAADAILQHRLLQPKVAIILGSGLGELAQQIVHPSFLSYEQIPHFPRTHAQGHAGRCVQGFLGGVPVVAFQGRAHRYEGWTPQELQFATRVASQMGAEVLIATNAAGGLNGRFSVGDLMVIDSHINWLWQPSSPSSLGTSNDDFVGFLGRGGNPYHAGLMRQSQSIARRNDIVLHQGCYLATHGPTYETRSEYRMFRWMGADAVGMSTLPEVLAALDEAMVVLAFSVITNVASTDIPQTTTHDEVVDSGKLAGPNLSRILLSLLEDMAGEPD